MIVKMLLLKTYSSYDGENYWEMYMNLNWRAITVLFFVGILIVLQLLYWVNPVTLTDLLRLRDELLQLVQQYSIISAFTYILIYTISIVFGIPVSATIIGGYLFGIWYGVVYTSVAIVIGSTLLCSFARFIMRDWLEKRYGNKLEPFNAEIERYGALYIITVHAIPFAPSFLPHIAAGISSLALYKIILANSFGALPLTIIYAVAGNYLHTINSLHTFMMYTTIFGLLLLMIWAGVFIGRYMIGVKD